MEEIDALDFNELIKPPRIWKATGDTYIHRKMFKDWAWHWDLDRQAWINDNGVDEDNEQILRIKSLPGVEVAEIEAAKETR